MTVQNLLTIQKAAKFFRVSEKTLRRWEESGYLMPIRTSGGHRRYSPETLKDFKKNKKLIIKQKSFIQNISLPSLPKAHLIENNTEYPEVAIKVTQSKYHTEEKKAALFRKPSFFISRRIVTFATVGVLTLTVFVIALTSSKFKNAFEKLSPFKNQASEKTAQIESLKEKLTGKENLQARVLAASSFQNLSFNVAVESSFDENVYLPGTLNRLGNTFSAVSLVLISR